MGKCGYECNRLKHILLYELNPTQSEVQGKYVIRWRVYMLNKKKIGIVVGSLRKDSFNMKIAKYIEEVMAKEYEITIANIGNLPLYNEDLDLVNPPTEWENFREEVGKWDAVLFITPEYNRSMPAVIKNALDVGSRPYGENMWGRKPGAVISSSPGGIGGFGSNHHLRQAATFLDIYMMQQPEMYLGNIEASFDGDVMKDSLKNFLSSFVENYINWIERF